MDSKNSGKGFKDGDKKPGKKDKPQKNKKDKLNANQKDNQTNKDQSERKTQSTHQSLNKDQKYQKSRYNSNNQQEILSQIVIEKVEQNLLQKNQSMLTQQNKQEEKINLMGTEEQQMKDLKKQFENDKNIQKQYNKNINKKIKEQMLKKIIQKKYQTRLIFQQQYKYENFGSQIKKHMTDWDEYKRYIFEYFFLKQAQNSTKSIFTKILDKVYLKKIPYNQPLNEKQIAERCLLVKSVFLKLVEQILEKIEQYKDIKIHKYQPHIQEQLNKKGICYHKNQFFQIYRLSTTKRTKQINELKKILKLICIKWNSIYGNYIIQHDGQYMKQVDKNIQLISNRNLREAVIYKKNDYFSNMNQHNQWDIIQNKQQIMRKSFNSSKYNNIDILGFYAFHFARMNFSESTVQQNKYQWLHLLAKTLGGKADLSNFIIGSNMFNQLMKIYQEIISDLRNKLNVRYTIHAQNIKYRPEKTRRDATFGICASEVTICIQIITNSLSHILMNSTYNPFQIIEPLKIQKTLVQATFQFFCKSKNIQLKSQLAQNLKNNQDEHKIYEIDFQYIQKQRSAQYLKLKKKMESYITLGIKGKKILKLLNIEIEVSQIQTNFVQQNPEISSYYKIIIVKPENFLDQIFKRQIFSSKSQWLPKTVGISEIRLQLQSNLLGIIFRVKTEELQLPSILKDILYEIFNFQDPVLIFEGGFIVFPNFLQSPQLPNYYTLSATIQNSKRHRQQNLGLSYSFQKLGLNFQFYLNNQQVNVNWKIISQMILYQLAQNEIKLDITFMVKDTMKILNGRTNGKINELFNIQGFDVDALELNINFDTKEIFLMFDIEIEETNIYFETKMEKQLINFKTSISDLNIRKLFYLIQKFTNQKISLDFEVVFQEIGLKIDYNRITKKCSFYSNVTAIIDDKKFSGSLSYKQQQQKFALQANAQLIKFMNIELKDPTLILQKSGNSQLMKYTGTFQYKSDWNNLQLSLKATLTLEKTLNSYDYLLCAQLDLQKQKQLTKKLNFAKLKKMTLYLDSKNKKKYLKIQTHQFELLNKKTNLDIILELENGLKLSGSINIPSEQKKSLLQLTKITLACYFASAQIEFQCQFKCNMYSNLRFVGGITIKPSKIGVKLKMFGVYKPCSFIQIGYLQAQNKSTQVQVLTNGQLFDLIIGGQIKIYNTTAQGKLQIKNNFPTHIYFKLQKLQISQLIQVACKLFNDTNKQQNAKIKKINVYKFEDKKEIELKKLQFQYNLNPFIIYGKILLKFYGNCLQAQLKFTTAEIYLKGKFYKPIKIGPLIVSGTDKEAGASIQLMLGKGIDTLFKLDCMLLIGPFNSKTKIEISKELIDFNMAAELFGTSFKSQFHLNYQKQQCSFLLDFNNKDSSQKDKLNNFILNKINQKNKQQQLKKNLESKENQQLMSSVSSLRSLRQKIMENFKEQSQKNEMNTQQKIKEAESPFTQQFYDNQNQLIKDFLVQSQIKRKKQEQLSKQIGQLNNYKYYLRKNPELRQLITQFQSIYRDQIHENCLQSNKLKQQKLNLLKNLNSKLEYKNNVIKKNNSNVMLNKESQNTLKGLYDQLWGYVVKAFNYICEKVKQAIEVVVPKVHKFQIKGDFRGNKGDWKYGFRCYISFTFLTIDYQIQYFWGNTFDTKQIEGKSIMQMTNYSLTYVKSMYLIPRHIAQHYKDDKQLFQKLQKKQILGLTLTYQQEVNAIQYNRDIFYKIQVGANPTLMSLSYDSNQKSQQKYCFRNNFSYQMTFKQDKIQKQKQRKKYIQQKIQKLKSQQAQINQKLLKFQHTPFKQKYEQQKKMKQIQIEQQKEAFKNIQSNIKQDISTYFCGSIYAKDTKKLARFLQIVDRNKFQNEIKEPGYKIRFGYYYNPDFYDLEKKNLRNQQKHLLFKREEKKITDKTYYTYSFTHKEKVFKLSSMKNEEINLLMDQQQPEADQLWYELQPLPQTDLKLPVIDKQCLALLMLNDKPSNNSSQ